MKSSGSGKSKKNHKFAIQQLIDRLVVSTEIVDILQAAGMESPDISILSDDFLAEMKDSERPNLALEALKKLLADKIRSRSQSHAVESRKYSERLTAAIARYHTNVISTVEVLQTRAPTRGLKRWRRRARGRCLWATGVRQSATPKINAHIAQARGQRVGRREIGPEDAVVSLGVARRRGFRLMAVMYERGADSTT